MRLLLLRCVMSPIVMTILVAKRLLVCVCILSGLRSMLRWACHLDVFLRQSSGRVMGRGNGVASRAEMCMCVRECFEGVGNLPGCNVQQSWSYDSKPVSKDS